jgi:hypothetical protein
MNISTLRTSIVLHASTRHITGRLNQGRIQVKPNILLLRCSSTQSNSTSKDTSSSNSLSRPPSYRISGTNTLNPSQPYDPSICPPESTRPPPLILPVRGSQSATQYYFKLAKVYISFYRAGLRSVWTNWGIASEVRKRIQASAREVRTAKSEAERHRLAAIGPQQTRAEYQVLARSMHDNKKLPLFVGMFVVTFEFFPVVVWVLRNWISDKLPYPCRQPSQVQVVRQQALERWRRTEEKWKGVDPATLDFYPFVLYMAEFHGLAMKVIPLSVQPWYMLIGRVKRHVEYLRYDDLMIGKNGVDGLIDEEVIISAVERGIWDPDTPMDRLRKRLQQYVNQTFKRESDLAKEDRKVKR